MDAADTGYHFGFEDATEGNDQRPSAYFIPNDTAWNAYNEGFLAGAQMLYSITGEVRMVWLPEVSA